VVSEVHSPHGGRHAAAATRTSLTASLSAIAGRAARLLLTTALVGLVVAIGVGKLVLHLGLSPVLTSSMRPSFAPGDAVVTRRVPVSQLRPGMVVVFVPPGHPSAFAHRIVAIGGTPSRPVLTTKGDANPAPDHWRATLSDPTVPQVVGAVPKVGYLLVWLREPRWRAAIIGVIGLLMTAMLTRSVLRSRPASPSHRPAHAL